MKRQVYLTSFIVAGSAIAAYAGIGKITTVETKHHGGLRVSATVTDDSAEDIYKLLKYRNPHHKGPSDLIHDVVKGNQITCFKDGDDYSCQFFVDTDGNVAPLYEPNPAPSDSPCPYPTYTGPVPGPSDSPQPYPHSPG